MEKKHSGPYVYYRWLVLLLASGLCLLPLWATVIGDSNIACLAGHIFMTVEDYLGRERRMAADFNRDVAPLGIEDVEGVVVT